MHPAPKNGTDTKSNAPIPRAPGATPILDLVQRRADEQDREQQTAYEALHGYRNDGRARRFFSFFLLRVNWRGHLPEAWEKKKRRREHLILHRTLCFTHCCRLLTARLPGGEFIITVLT